MKPHRLVALIACVVATLATGAAAPSATVDSCIPTDVVFYTTDTVRLATELSKFGSPCADYYLSVTPNATGGPRGGGPITTIRSLGPRFHALTEVRLPVWASYAATHGWYAAGVEVRRLMAAAGYNTALGDSWAINEVGAPTTAQMGIDVLRNTGTARQDLRDFVRGLHTGSGAPSAGLVFAAEPLQVTTDLAQYKQELLSWYGDAPFWEDLSRHVKFWAQETYADARTWGVEGSTLAERTAHLTDYFEHGSRLAAAGGSATATAAAFFDGAYVPLANAAFRWGLPNLETGIGFGYTEIELGTMLNFVSAQTYAQRASGRDRLGYAFVPRNAIAAETLALADRLAASVQASQSDAAGACGADGASCEGVVAGAQFNDAWKTFTDVTPPTIVPHVAGPLGNAGWYTGDVIVTWEVRDAQSSILSASGCGESAVTVDTDGLTFTCTATSYGGSRNVSVTVKRDATAPDVTCEPSRDVISPPNHKLVPIEVAVTVTDATAGAAGFTLTSESGGTDDLVGFDLGVPDVSGWARAERAGNGGDREYELAYTGRDAAGNTRHCATHIIVPHDQGGQQTG